MSLNISNFGKIFFHDSLPLRLRINCLRVEIDSERHCIRLQQKHSDFETCSRLVDMTIDTDRNKSPTFILFRNFLGVHFFCPQED